MIYWLRQRVNRLGEAMKRSSVAQFYIILAGLESTKAAESENDKSDKIFIRLFARVSILW